MSERWLFERRRYKRKQPLRRRSPLTPKPTTTRVEFDLNIATAAEILDCVRLRASWYTTRNLPVPHITMVALKMLCETLGAKP